MKYNPLVGSSFVLTPLKLCKTYGTNVQNNEKYFLWSVLASLYPIASNPQCVKHYVTYKNELNMSCTSYPITTNQIKRLKN